MVFFRWSGQGRTSEEMWAGTWMTGKQSQPLEGNFWSEGIAAPKYKQALWLDVCDEGGREQGPGHLEACGRWPEATGGDAGQSDPGKGVALSYPRRGLACLPSQFRAGAPFSLLLTAVLSRKSHCEFLSHSRLYAQLLGDLCDSRSSLVTRRKRRKMLFLFWWFATPIFLFGNRLSFRYKPLK